MKIILPLILALFVSTAYCQDVTLPKAIVTKVNINSDTTVYSFVSNKFIDEYKAPLLQQRLLNRYSEIIDISINYQSQIVEFKILTSNSTAFLEAFINHFKFSGYEIN